MKSNFNFLDFTRDAFGNLLQTTNNRGSYANETDEESGLLPKFLMQEILKPANTILETA